MRGTYPGGFFSSAHKRLRGVVCQPATPWQNQYQGSFRDYFEAEAEMYSRYEALSASGVFVLRLMKRPFYLRFLDLVLPVHALTKSIFSSRPRPNVLTRPRRASWSTMTSSTFCSAGVGSPSVFVASAAFKLSK